ncbi:MAG: tetratricopeptide repeat protein [Anaerolineae bacterium]
MNNVYDIDYFETYRNQATTKQLSEFYRVMGDDLLEQQEWAAAEEAFRTAVEINPNNIEATYGIAKSTIFSPLEGQRYVAPETARIRLDYLLENFPDDYQLDYFKGLIYLYQWDDVNARVWFRKAIEEHPEFAAGYANLGYIEVRNGNIDGALDYTTQAVDLDPESAMASNNLGFMHMLKGDFEQAVTSLQRADALSPTLQTEINLGVALLYTGQSQAALQVHQHALMNFNEPGNENERYLGYSGWLYNFMPQTPDDEETIKYYVVVNTLKDKQIFLRYALSFDYALVGDVENADEEFKAAYNLDEIGFYRNYFYYNMQSIQNFLSVDGETKEWFDQHRDMLIS